MAPIAVAPQPEDPDLIAQIRQYAPNGVKNLRACLRCRLIMTKEQFIQFGCPTCRDVLHMQDDEGRVLACTSSSFQGFIASLRPGAFVSRFNGLDKRLPGCYALSVQGTIPDYILHESEFERESDAGGFTSRGSRRPGAPKSPSLHLTQDSDTEASDAKNSAKKRRTSGVTSSPNSSDANDNEDALKGLFSPASPVSDNSKSSKKKTAFKEAPMAVDNFSGLFSPASPSSSPMEKPMP
mmetsp:Transcript_74610/g.147804  ORF Transcript_74610/g.147804 Transcript_74610/m.147804 type:complete len:238 (-) Transcript_74610:66-779(-)